MTLWYILKVGKHEKHLRIVLQIIREQRLYAKLKKCQFWLESISFFRCIISKRGISIDLVKVDTILDWSWPTSVTEAYSFLALVGYNGRFVEGFSHIEMPLTQLTHKRTKFDWMEGSERSFQELNMCFVLVHILTLSSRSEGFTIYSAISRKELGCALMHNGKVVAYASNNLNPKSKTTMSMIWNWLK